MNQLSMDFEPPSLPVALAMGQVGAQLAADRAEREQPGFQQRAQAFVLAYLRQHGKASGEEITDACKGSGIVPPDDRAFGPVYSSLARRRLIEVAGWCLRRKGHGTAGGRVWRLMA